MVQDAIRAPNPARHRWEMADVKPGIEVYPALGWRGSVGIYKKALCSIAW